MNPLNDDELSALLQQTKHKPLEPSADLADRVVRGYHQSVGRPPKGRLLLLRPVYIPLPLAAIAAVLLAAGLGYRRTPITLGGRNIDVPMTRERVVYRDCTSAQAESGSAISNLSFKEFQPVRQIKPRVVESSR
jgi:hypothetical protein